MEKSLVILSPYKGFELQLPQLFNELHFHPTVIEGHDITDDLISELHKLFTGDSYPDVIISRGAVASHVSKIFSNTIMVRIEPDYFDILNAINSAKRHGDKIGIIMHPETAALMSDKIAMTQNILGLSELKIYPFETVTDIQNQVIRGQSDGMNGMVGGGTAALESGVANNMPVEFIESGKDSVMRAIHQAISIINVRRKEKEQLENLKLVIDYISAGVMAINGDKIILINTKLENILGVKNAQLYNQGILRLNSTIAEFIKKDKKDKDIIRIGEVNFLMEKSYINKSGFADKIILFHDVEKIQAQEQQIRSNLHAKGFIAKYNFDEIIGQSKEMIEVINKAHIYASTDASVLLIGNSGTGKELLTQSIHNESSRKNKPFVPINCGAIPENLLESEFFGYEEGAFSGAKRKGKIGLFELAHTGTIFLDEINSLPMSLQSKLLRVIQEKEIRRIGSESIISVDVRIIAATNQNMYKLMQENKFRTDLYYRLNILNLNLPDLSNRKDDIEMLANHFLDHYSTKYHLTIPQFKSHEVGTLTAHSWTGNVRELENTIHRFVLLYGKEDNDDLLYSCIEKPVAFIENQTLHDELENSDIVKIRKDTLAVMEKEIIVSYLDENQWNKQLVADKLGIDRSTLWRKLKDYTPVD